MGRLRRPGCLWAPAAALLALTGRAAAAQPEGCTGRGLDCFWTAAARLERFWTLADYELFLAEGRRSGGERAGAECDLATSRPAATESPLGFRHIYFVVKASRENAAAALLMERAWLHSAGNRIFLVDELLPGLPESLQVVVNDGRGEAEMRDSRRDKLRDPVATSRLLIWLRQAGIGRGIGGIPEETRWLVVLDDDVFVNLERLYRLLQRHPSPDHPVAFAHVLSNTEVYDFDMPCLESGALVLNRQAVDRLREVTSCKACPYIGSESISLAYCMLVNAVPLVHVPAMHCHAEATGDADRDLTRDMLAHHWVAAGGLSASALGREASALQPGQTLPQFPFEEDFPEDACAPPAGPRWTAARLAEKAAACAGRALSLGADAHAEAASLARAALRDGDSLSADGVEAYFGAAAPEAGEDALREVPYAGEAGDWRAACAALALDVATGPAGGGEPWRFLLASDVWLHGAQVGRYLAGLRLSGVLRSGAPPLAFAFLAPGGAAADLRAGLLANAAAARLLAGRCAAEALRAADAEALGITVVHTPWMVPSAAGLPQGLRGMVSEATATGAWSIGRVRGPDMMDDLDAKVRGRSFFARAVLENVADLARSAGPEARRCGGATEADALEEARSWLSFLHNDEDHIKTIRGFVGGRREFRTLHAMYRSEASEVLPVHGVDPDTVLVARDCPKPRG